MLSFQEHRHAVQGTAHPLVLPLLVERRRNLERLWIDLEHRAQCRPAPVESVDAIQITPSQLQRRQLACGQRRGDILKRQFTFGHAIGLPSTGRRARISLGRHEACGSRQ